MALRELEPTRDLPYETRLNVWVVGRGKQHLEVCDRREGQPRQHWFVGINGLTGTESGLPCSCDW